LFPSFARNADRIAIVSYYSKADIIKCYKIDERKIDVIFSGIKNKQLNNDSERLQSIRKEYSGGKPYFFFAGSTHPKKNMLRLIEAFDLFKKQNLAQARKLLLTGYTLWNSKMFEKPFKKQSL